MFWADHLHLQNLEVKKYASSIFTQLQQYKNISTNPKLVPVSSVACNWFISVCLWTSFTMLHCCWRTIVQNKKHSSLFYNVTSVTSVKACNFFVSYQSFCEVYPIHVDVFHATTDSIMKHWNAISLYRPRIFPAPVKHISNFSRYVNKSYEVDCQNANSFDASTTA